MAEIREYILNTVTQASGHLKEYYMPGASHWTGGVAYTVTCNMTNVSSSSVPATIMSGDEKYIYFTPNKYYRLPSSITVKNATYTWNYSTGELKLYNPTNNVEITIIGAIIEYSIIYDLSGVYATEAPPPVQATSNSFRTELPVMPSADAAGAASYTTISPEPDTISISTSTEALGETLIVELGNLVGDTTIKVNLPFIYNPAGIGVWDQRHNADTGSNQFSTYFATGDNSAEFTGAYNYGCDILDIYPNIHEYRQQNFISNGKYYNLLVTLKNSNSEAVALAYAYTTLTDLTPSTSNITVEYIDQVCTLNADNEWEFINPAYRVIAFESSIQDLINDPNSGFSALAENLYICDADTEGGRQIYILNSTINAIDSSSISASNFQNLTFYAETASNKSDTPNSRSAGTEIDPVTTDLPWMTYTFEDTTTETVYTEDAWVCQEPRVLVFTGLSIENEELLSWLNTNGKLVMEW